MIIIENTIKYEMLGTLTTESPLLADGANHWPRMAGREDEVVKRKISEDWDQPALFLVWMITS